MAVLSAVTILPATLGATSPNPGHCAVVNRLGTLPGAAADPARPGGPSDPTRKHRGDPSQTNRAKARADAADKR